MAAEETAAHYEHLSLNEESAEDDETIPSTDLLSIDEALERLGMGPFQYRLLCASGLCFASDAMQVILLSFLAIVVQEEWHLTDAETASIPSALFAGSLMGTLVLGPLADTYGRKPLFVTSNLLIVLFGVATSLATHYVWLVAALFGVGVGVGGLVVPFDLLAEVLPAERRGTNLLLIEYFWTVGCLYIVGVADLSLPAWRTLVGWGTLPCLLSLGMGLTSLVPESPRWLVAEGRLDDALEVLQRAAVVNGSDFPDTIRLKKPPEQEKEAGIAELFTPEWRDITLRLWGAWGAMAFGYYGTLMAITRVFDRTVPDEQNAEFDYTAIFVSSAAELIGTTLVIVAVDRVGRIPSQVVSYSCAGVAVGLLCWLASHGSKRSTLMSLALIARVMEMAGTCVTWVSTAEILTTHVRSTGHATANAVARLGAFCSPYLVESHRIPLWKLGAIMFLVHVITALCVCKLPETKGRSMGAGTERQSTENEPLALEETDEDVPVSHAEPA